MFGSVVIGADAVIASDVVIVVVAAVVVLSTVGCVVDRSHLGREESTWTTTSFVSR